MSDERGREAISARAELDSPPDTNPRSAFWQNAPALFMDRDVHGNEVPGHRTEIRSKWTKSNLYFLFICPYEQLHLKPGPVLDVRTDGLWNWDVAEVFVGSVHEPIHRYKEFELSPQEEWLDFSIDLSRPDQIAADRWNSGFQVAARVEPEEKIWYGFMKIPYASIEAAKPAAGNTLRINFFRSQGPSHVEVAWQPPLQASFHAPEHFGTLRLIH